MLLIGLVAIYLVRRFYGRWSKHQTLYNVYYMVGFLVLLVSLPLLIFLGPFHAQRLPKASGGLASAAC